MSESLISWIGRNHDTTSLDYMNKLKPQIDFVNNSMKDMAEKSMDMVGLKNSMRQ